jgi:hypothetical protein
VISLFLLTLAAGAASPADCTAAGAVPADIRAMARDPAAWLDRCIRVDGYAEGSLFYADAAGRRAARAFSGPQNDGWLGLYFRRITDYTARPRRGAAIGLVGDCAREDAAARAVAGPGEVIWPTGYCHGREGLMLIGASFEPRRPGRRRPPG